MAAKRDRILYASQSVRANGRLLYRVQTLGSNSTFTSEDVFELGHLDKVDVVDDVPAVAVAVDTNDFGGVNGMAILAGMNPDRMYGAPTSSGAYLRTNAVCTGSGVRYYHGLALADYTLCDGVKMWAPVQNEASLGTSDDDIQMTLYMDKVYVNSITLTYNVGATATENYAAETDNKRWLVNGAKFITQEEWTIASPSNSFDLNVGLAAGKVIPELSDCRLAFLAITSQGKEGVEVRAKADRQGIVYPVAAAAAAGTFGYDGTNRTLTLPTDAATLWTEAIKIVAVYAADAFGSVGGNTGGDQDSDVAFNKYFESAPSADYPQDVGAVRQGQIEVYLLDPDTGLTNADWDMTLRMQTVTITATPTRTPLNELGHLRPYARPMNFPVALTTNTTTTANDLEMWAKVSGLTPVDYEAGGSGTDIALNHLMSKDNLYLIIKIYQQTDDEAGGSGLDRNAMLDSMLGEEYYDWDGAGTYANVGSCANPDRERALKTIIVPKLKITAENYNNAIGGRGGGGGATQEFNFRSTNELYIVKGDVHMQDVFCMERNTAADQW